MCHVITLSAADGASFKISSETRTQECFLLLQPVGENMILFKSMSCLSAAVNSDGITTLLEVFFYSVSEVNGSCGVTFGSV